ncbi:hypothetical protein [Streptomyces smyrnaeus]|uniref:hypothetical protein n=1 Tax=Streptomyces smyrnaeus TaxID=1387713 RepID=UPI0033FC68AA
MTPRRFGLAVGTIKDTIGYYFDGDLARFQVTAESDDGTFPLHYRFVVKNNRPLLDRMQAEGWGEGDRVLVMFGSKEPGQKKKGAPGYWPDSDKVGLIVRLRAKGDPVSARHVDVLKRFEHCFSALKQLMVWASRVRI